LSPNFLGVGPTHPLPHVCSRVNLIIPQILKIYYLFLTTDYSYLKNIDAIKRETIA